MVSFYVEVVAEEQCPNDPFKGTYVHTAPRGKAKNSALLRRR